MTSYGSRESAREREDRIVDETHWTLMAMDEAIPFEILWEMVEPGMPLHEFRWLMQRRGPVRFLDDDEVVLHAAGRRDAGAGAGAAKPNPLRDAAHDFLARAGEPVEFSTIHSAVGHGRSESSLQNVLAKDDRITRTDRAKYGLTVWGFEVYDSILGLVERYLERAGGTAKVSDVVNDLTARFSVNGQSVRAFANSENFVKVSRGVIRLREDGEVPEDDIPDVSEITGCFVLAGRRKLRIVVREKYLSGHAAPAPRGFAGALGVRPLVTSDLPTDLGHSLSVSRKGFNDTIGRLRPVLSDLDLVAGDHLFLQEPAEPGGEIAVEGLAGRDLDALEDPAQRAAAMMGLPDLEDLEAAADALGLRRTSSLSAIASTLRQRNEAELAEWLEEAFAESDEGPVARDFADLLGI